MPQFRVSLSRVYQVRSFSACLLDDLPAPELWGETSAVFQRSCYVLGTGGRITCIVGQCMDNGPLTIRVGFPANYDMESLGVKVGMSLRWDGADFWLGETIRFHMSGAICWVPPIVTVTSPSKEILSRLRTLIEALGEDVPEVGLASLLHHGEDIAYGRVVALRIKEGVVYSALPAVLGLARGICARDEREIDAAVRRLVGLGPGLTPSGDDLLGGMMMSLTAVLNPEYGANDDFRTRDGAWANWEGIISSTVDSISRHASNRTTSISAVLLNHAATGVGSASVHRLLHALLQDSSASSPLDAALAVVKFGQTSGWDCLAGIVLGIYLGLQLRYLPGGRFTSLGPISGMSGTFGDRVQT